MYTCMYVYISQGSVKTSSCKAKLQSLFLYSNISNPIRADRELFTKILSLYMLTHKEPVHTHNARKNKFLTILPARACYRSVWRDRAKREDLIKVKTRYMFLIGRKRENSFVLLNRKEFLDYLGSC